MNDKELEKMVSGFNRLLDGFYRLNKIKLKDPLAEYIVDKTIEEVNEILDLQEIEDINE